MNRRRFLGWLASGVLTCTVLADPARGGVLASPVTTNRLRPPGAVDEDDFPGRCIRCGRCVEVCPYRSIRLLDIRSGVQAGTPLISAEKTPCYLCMKCVQVCPTGTLRRVAMEDVRMGLAVINHFTCYAWSGQLLCRTCYDKCPFKNRAIRLEALKPVVEESVCTGCGLCTHACPATSPDGKKAINIEPIYAGVRER